MHGRLHEAHKIAALQSVKTLLKEARKYGGSVWLSSQEPSDFDDFVWANCGTSVSLCLGLDKDAAMFAKHLGDTSLTSELRDLSIGECYLRNTKHNPYVRFDIEEPI